MPLRQKNPLVEYFAGIRAGIVTTYKGLRLTIGYFFTKPVTIQYPEEHQEIPEGYRGLHGYDESKCLLCKGCAAICPVDAFAIESAGKGKDAMITRFDIDYGKCLFCDLCVGACPTNCLWMTTQFDLAGQTREGCVLHFARAKTPEEIAAHQAMLARKEAEKKAKLEAGKKES